MIGTYGTTTVEFTLFGKVARQIVSKPMVALIRSASKNQHGSSGAEFEHMLPKLAALVSQKFTFSVSISQKNHTQRNVSFQVNSVVTFFGKQTNIPKPIENVYDRATESSQTMKMMVPQLHLKDHASIKR
jgi:replication factor A1